MLSALRYLRGLLRFVQRRTDSCIVIPFGRKPVIALRLGNSLRFLCLRTRGLEDAPTLRSVFEDQFFRPRQEVASTLISAHLERIHSSGNTPHIIDCGAHVGLSAVWFKNSYPSSSLIGVEPLRENYNLALENTSCFTDVTILHRAIHLENSPLMVRRGSQTDSSTVALPSELSIDDEAVDGVTPQDLNTFDANHEPFILKLDIEGSEERLFSRPQNFLMSFPVIFFEPHDWLNQNSRTASPLLRQALKHDFQIFVQADMLLLVRSLPTGES